MRSTQQRPENVVYKLKLVTWALESVFVGSELGELCVVTRGSSGAVRVTIFCRWEPDVALRYETEQRQLCQQEERFGDRPDCVIRLTYMPLAAIPL